MVFHVFVCRYDLYTTSVATAAAAKATPNALRGNRGRGTQRENTTLLGTHKTNRCSKRGWQSSSSLFRNLSLCLRPPLLHHSTLAHTHPNLHTHTYDTAMLCFILHPRLPHSLFVPRNSPSTVHTTTSFILYVYAYIYIIIQYNMYISHVIFSSPPRPSHIPLTPNHFEPKL